jgi:hypothetical protein
MTVQQRKSGYPTSDQRALGVLAHQKAQTAAIVEARDRRATRRVASQSTDAVDCAKLLSMLGLDADMGKRGAA